jgi:hypothetical protein
MLHHTATTTTSGDGSSSTADLPHSQGRTAAARAGWVQRRETFTRHSCERPLLTSSRLLFDSTHIEALAQQPLSTDTSQVTIDSNPRNTSKPMESEHARLHTQQHLLNHQSSSNSSSPADLESLAEKGKVHRNKSIQSTRITTKTASSQPDRFEGAPSITVLHSEPDDWFSCGTTRPMPFERSRTAVPLASLTRFDPQVRPNSQPSERSHNMHQPSVSRSSSSNRSLSSSSSCCDCGDSDEQLQRPIIRSRSDRLAFRPQLIATCDSPPTSGDSPRSLSVGSNDSTDDARLMPHHHQRPCRSLLCLLDSPCTRSVASSNRPQLRRATATAGSVDSSSSWSSDAFFQPQVGQSSSERLSSRSSLERSQTKPSKQSKSHQDIASTTTTKPAKPSKVTQARAVPRVLGRRQTIADRKLNANRKELSTSSATRLLTETSIDPSIDSEPELCYHQLDSSIERSFDSVEPVDMNNNRLSGQTAHLLRPSVGVERSHTVSANLRSMARSIGRLVGADTAHGNSTASSGKPDLNCSLDRSSTFDSLRSLESRTLPTEPRSKTSIGNSCSTTAAASGGLQRIRSLNPIRVLRPMRGLNALRSFGIARQRSLSAAELREERDDPSTDRMIRLSRTTQPPQPSQSNDLLSVGLSSIGGQCHSHPSLDSMRAPVQIVLDISFAFDQTARKLLVCLRQGQLYGLNPANNDPVQLQAKLSLLPGRREKCKSKLRTCQDGRVVFDQQFSWSRIRPESVAGLALHCSLEVIGGGAGFGGKSRVIGEQLLPFSICRPQLQQRRVQLHLDPPSVDTCQFEPDVGPTADQPETLDRLTLESRRRVQPIVTRSKTNRSSNALLPAGLFQWSGSNSALSSLDAAARPELLLGLAYNATTGRLQVSVVRGSQLHVRSGQKPPHSYVKCALLSCTGQELARGKTSVRRAQPNPLFKQTFAFQVINDVSFFLSLSWDSSTL